MLYNVFGFNKVQGR